MSALLESPFRSRSSPYTFADPTASGRGVIQLAQGRVEDLVDSQEVEVVVESLKMRLEEQEAQLASLKRGVIVSAMHLRKFSLFSSLLIVVLLAGVAFYWSPRGGPSALFYVTISLPLIGVATACALALHEGGNYDEKI